MTRTQSFEDLIVWQKGKELVCSMYGLSGNFPKEELFGLSSQIKRSALSVPANIAEGFGRYHYLDKVKFFLNARGSLYELKSHLLISQELGFLSETDATEIRTMIDDLAVSLNNLIRATRGLRKSR